MTGPRGTIEIHRDELDLIFTEWERRRKLDPDIFDDPDTLSNEDVGQRCAEFFLSIRGDLQTRDLAKA